MPLSLEPAALVQNSPIPAEKRLWLSVMAQAIDDLRHPNFSESVVDWIMDDGDEVGSFNWVCELLEVDAGRLRCRL